MAVAKKVDSNITGLRFAEEQSIGVLGTNPTWHPLEPNSYSDFGGQVTTTARNPINAARQRRKGVVTDLEASGGFQQDLTQENLMRMLQGFYFAEAREKFTTHPLNATREPVTSIDSTADKYVIANNNISFDDLSPGDLVVAKGFKSASNNGLKTVDSVTSTELTVAENLVSESAPPTDASITRVGVEFADAGVEVDVSGDLPVLDFQAGSDPAILGLIPGEWIYIGGDTSGTKFASTDGSGNEVNNGYARVKSITTGDAGQITLDKTQFTMQSETGTTGITLRIFTGRVLKNEADPDKQRRFSYQLERTLGSPDSASSNVQAEYLIGSVANELTLNFNTADKVTADLNFVALDNKQQTQSEGLKSGDRPDLTSGDAFNTTSHFARLKMSILDPRTANPTSLFAFVTEFTVPINNNVSVNKAISVLGGFDVTAGQFTVDGSATAYFSQVEAVQAVRENADVTLDFAMAKDNAGIVTDVPLIALGGGRLDVSQDEPITLPLELGAAGDRVFNHTLLQVFFDYLPDRAMGTSG